MQVEASIDEADIGRLKVGQRASFTVDAFPRRSFSGSITQIRKAAQVIQNVVTYVVTISADNPDLALVPGMTANTRITVDRRDNVLKIANAALRFKPADEGRSAGKGPATGGRDSTVAVMSMGHAYVLPGDGKPQPVEVRTGLSDGTWSELLSGALKEGDEVIVGTQDTRNGAKVAPAAGPRMPF